MKALKTFIKPFEILQRSVKIKTELLFQYNFQKYTGREGLDNASKMTINFPG